MLELVAGADIELSVHLAQVVFDCPRAEEQAGGDLRVRKAAAGQPGDLGLLGGERVACFGGALAGGLAPACPVTTNSGPAAALPRTASCTKFRL